MEFSVEANVVNVLQEKIFYGRVNVAGGKIRSIENLGETKAGRTYLLPGFVDAHVHIESSMLVPSEFARLAVVHGTVATISDPHEIANVCGREGVDFMINNGKTVPLKFHFGAPSCVPATTFETAGALLDAKDVAELLRSDDIFYLSEMMNFPGVLKEEEEVMKKLEAAVSIGKPIDGHSPGLRGDDAKQYIHAGNKTEVIISTDHECFTKEEALDKLNLGMKILIREGSAAKNFEALIDLLTDYPESVMFCSDDKHPDSLAESHIEALCKRAVEKKIDVFKVLRAACVNPVKHYNMRVGLLSEGDPADFIEVADLENFSVKRTFIDGIEVAKNNQCLFDPKKVEAINNFHCKQKTKTDFEISAEKKSLPVIEALEGQLITNNLTEELLVRDGKYISNVSRDILKIVVVNRYQEAEVAKAFVKNFGLQRGAIASSVAHDSHNIIAVGVDDLSIMKAVNIIVEKKGGISCVENAENGDGIVSVLSLPVAGLMSDENGYEVAQAYTALDEAAKNLGSKLTAPFMTLSFMALLVIPHLKLSDRGLFNGDTFSFIN